MSHNCVYLVTGCLNSWAAYLYSWCVYESNDNLWPIYAAVSLYEYIDFSLTSSIYFLYFNLIN